MKVEQVAVFLENKSGRLAEISNALQIGGLNILGLSLADTVDFGILRMIVDDPARAVSLLKKEGFTVSSNAVVAVEVDDQPGGLNFILQIIKDQGLNLEYMYHCTSKSAGVARMIFRFEEPDLAAEILRQSGVGVLQAQDIYSNR